MPFHRPLAVGRAYLHQLGVTRLELMEAYRQPAASDPDAVAAESLGLAPEEYAIIAGTHAASTREFYGFGPAEGGPTWWAAMAKVDQLLARTGLELAELTAALRTWFVNPDQAITIQVPSLNCDVSAMTLAGPDGPGVGGAGADRLHRFVRLWRGLRRDQPGRAGPAWSMSDLDRALFTVGAANLDTAGLRRLDGVRRGVLALRTPLAECLSLWADIDVWGEDSLYLKLFRNRAVLALDQSAALALTYPALDPEIRNSAKMPYLATGQPLGQHIPAVLAGVRLTEPELRMVMAREGLSDATVLSVAALSRILRYAVLARSTRLRIADLLTMLRLTGVNPFTPTDPTGLAAFLTDRQRVAAARVSVATLDYVCRGVTDPLAGVAPTPNEVGNALTTLRTGLLAVAADNAMPAEDPTHDALTARLAGIVAPDAVEPLKAMLLGSGSAYPSGTEAAFVAKHLSTYVDPAAALSALAYPGPLTASQQQSNVAWLLGVVRDYRARDVVVTALGSALRLPAPTMALLLEGLLTSRVMLSAPAMADYLALLTGDPVPAHATAYELAHKAALAVRGLDLTDRELAHIHANAAAWDGFSLDALPLTEVIDPVATANFARWARLADLAALRSRLPRGERTLVDVFGHDVSAAPSPLVALTDDLAEVCGWPLPALHALIGPDGLNLAVADLRTEKRLLELERCLNVAHRLGVDPVELFDWATKAPDAPDARKVVRAAKARYDETAWLEVAQELNDELRERCRDALVAYLLPRLDPALPSTEADLYGYFLMDVQMSSCTLTSRIKQAISAVQLFVQRCLLGMEDAVKPDLIDARQWQWRRSYRVWEANRKVFLYPENWIRPELDRDRTPLFRELETGLLQADPTDEQVESVYLRYLEQLDDVARLKLVGLYHQYEEATGAGDNGIDLIHVVASTIDGEPRIHYYRRLVNRCEWMPWERIELEIGSDHVVPVVWGRRLHLFWLELTAKAFDKKYPYGKEYDGPPAQYYEARLAWSELRRGRWTSRRTAGGPLRLDAQIHEHTTANASAPQVPPPLNLPDRYSMQLDESPDLLTLRVYAHYKSDPLLDYSSADKEFTDVFRIRGSFKVSSYRGATTVSTVAFGTGGYTEDYPIAVPNNAEIRANQIVRTAKGTLALGGGPSHWPILGQITNFRMVRQATTGLAESPKKLYPFFLSDDRRHYLAMPKVAATFEDENLLETILKLLGSGAPPPTYTEVDGGPPVYAYYYTPPGQHSKPPTGDLVEALLAASTRLAFSSTQHPYTGELIKALNRDGLDGLLSLTMQQLSADTLLENDFAKTYQPTDSVAGPLPRYNVDFDLAGAYSRYNWELFLLAPMLVADRLCRDGRYEQARRWIHFIFDPTTDDPTAAPTRFWRLLPFRTNTALERAQDLMELLAYDGSDASVLARREAVVEQYREWVARPFEPHRIARLRLVAYQKYVVMSYLDCLLAHADALFRRDTIESNNEAAQLYLLALAILGRRPARVPLPGKLAPKSYDDLAKLHFGEMTNPIVELENVVPPFAKSGPANTDSGAASVLLGGQETLYFCTPDNEKLRGYWDQVEDRLFKLRHCLNIEGQLRMLPLFEPPIDPAALVRAVAAGLDLGAATADQFAPLSRFRFTYLLGKAVELCGELRSLAALLLGVLEKGDAEALADLRVSHEVALLKSVRAVRETQLKEAQLQHDALTRTEEMVKRRRDFYAEFVHRNDFEAEQLARMKSAQKYQELANAAEVGVAAAAQIPNITTGSSGSMGSPVLTYSFGGANAVAGLQSTSRLLSWKAGHESYHANLAALEAGWARRADDVSLQEDLANKELAQIAKQLAAATARIIIATTELANHDQQIEQAGEVADFLRDKFTTVELYQWMAAQVSAVYHQAYKLAFDLAKRAERAHRYEHGLTTSAIISYGWEGGRKGLLAAERLALDLKRLDAAWMDAAPPPYEVTKHVSLVLHDPTELVKLKRTGACEIELPETLYDADHPGQYQRRLRSLRVTIPCVTGPYTSINAKVTLVHNRERIVTDTSTGYEESVTADDSRFRYGFAAVQSIVTSHGRSDPGRFALGADPSVYMPFEGAGAICRLALELPRESNSFDFDTISDVVLTVEYTAREGGDQLFNAALKSLADLTKLPVSQGGLNPPLQRLFSIRHEFGSDWHSFLRPAAGAEQVLNLLLLPEHFPYAVRHADLSVRQIDLHVLARDGATVAPAGVAVTVTLPEHPQSVSVNVAPPAGPGEPASGSLSNLDSVPAIGKWILSVPGATTPLLNPKNAEDMLILVTYTAT